MSTTLARMARTTGRGVVVGFGFDLLIQALLFTQNLVVPRLIGPEGYGLFALASAAVGVGLSLREFGVHEKVVQEQEVDLPRAYSVAFTLELLTASALALLVLAVAPLIARWYDRPELVPLIAVLAFTMYSTAFANLPSALYLRRFAYGRRNLLVAIGPVARFAVTVPLAFAGAGVWSLVLGAVAGLAASGAAALWLAPLRPRLRLEGDLVRRYVAYGWPLWVAGLLGIATTVGGTFVISSFLGIAALGFFALAQRFAQQASRLDIVLAQAILPVLARDAEDRHAQRRAFETANRLTVLWSGPLGFGLAVLAPGLVDHVLGPKWAPAEFLLRMQGLSIVLTGIGHSWDVFFRARGNTRPTLWFRVISEGWVFAVLLPAAVLWGLDGAGIAIAFAGLLAVAVRQAFVRRIFPGVRLLWNARRELLATAAAAGVAELLARTVWRPASLLGLGAFALLFVALTGVAVLAVDGSFLRRLWRLLRSAETVPAEPVDMAEPMDAVEARDVSAAAYAAPSHTPAETVLHLPGAFPFVLTPGPGALWLTLRDVSAIGRLDLADGGWRTWRLPSWPHVAALDEQGRAWFALTIAGQVARVDPEGRVRRRRLGRSRELLGAAWDDGRCLVVDSGRGLLWTVDDDGASSESLPAGMRRPDLVSVDDDGTRWISDTAMPALARIPADAPARLIPVADGQRALVIDTARGVLWAGHTGLAAVSRVPLDGTPPGPPVPLPGVPFGLAAAPDGRLWAALPERDQVVAFDEGGLVRVVDLEPGDAPHSVAWAGGSLWVSCSRSGRLLRLDGQS